MHYRWTHFGLLNTQQVATMTKESIHWSGARADEGGSGDCDEFRDGVLLLRFGSWFSVLFPNTFSQVPDGLGAGVESQ